MSYEPRTRWETASGLPLKPFYTYDDVPAWHQKQMNVAPGARELKDGENELSVRFESPDLGGVKLVKTWTVKRGAYDIAVRHEVVNTGTAPVAPKRRPRRPRPGVQRCAHGLRSPAL